MEFSLLNAGLLAGIGLAALPVILHLFMKQTPKHVVFPALRLIKERQKRSKKKMRVKNWLLLLARMAILALMALALARPTLYSQVPLGDASVPTALGLVFDTSLSMGYKEKDKTRLEEAKERAKAILDQVPDTSLVFPVNSADPGTPVGLSPSAARKWIDNLAIRPVNRPLNAAMGDVYPAIAECDRPRHEVYVFTDLTRSSWNPDRPADGLDRVEKSEKMPGGRIATYILGLAAQDLSDVSIDRIDLSSNTATQGESIEVRGIVRATGAKPVQRVVEFFLDDVKRDQRLVEIPAGGQTEVSFRTPAKLPEEGLHRGELRLSGEPDPLNFNDARFFTFKVQPALKVLIITEQQIDSDFVVAALDPDPTPSSSRSYEIETIRPREIMSRFRDNIRDFATVFLLNVTGLDEDAWGLLNAYVHQGGGLMVGLGDRCQPENYNGLTASQLLPAQLETAVAAKTGTTLGKVTDLTHPLFQRFAKEIDSQLNQVPIYRYWTLKAPESSRTLLSFSDQAPALLERSFKGARTGRVLLWSTPLSRRPQRTQRGAWNEFPSPSFGWGFFVLMNMTVPYFSGTSEQQLNFEAGENVLIALGQDARYPSFVVTGPDQKTAEAISPSAGTDVLQIEAPQLLGQWAVTAKGGDGKEARFGFSLNFPPGESQFTPLEPKDLDTIFGKNNYSLAENYQALKEKREGVLYGQELFPWLMFLILIIVTLENFLANTFYKETPKTAPAGASA